MPAPALEASGTEEEQQGEEQPQEGQQHATVAANTAIVGKKTGVQPPPPAAYMAPPWLLLAGAAAGAAAAVLLTRSLRSRGSARRAHVSKHQVYTAVVHLTEPSTLLPPHPTRPLGGRSLALSDRLAVQSVETRCGSDLWKASQQPSGQSHACVDALVNAGALGAAVVVGEPLGLGPLLLLGASCGTVPNPAGKGHVHGGGDFGAAVAVTARLHDLALTVDELGSARIPAACCGAYALRPTAGVLPLEGAQAAAPSLATPALVARDPRVLLRAGEVLRLPGGGAASEVPNYLVAEDFFACCCPEVQHCLPAVVAAVKRWAGPDQAQGLSLCEWLYHRVQSLHQFLPGGPPEGNGSPATPQQRTEEVLQSLAAAAEAVRQWEFAQGAQAAWVAENVEQLAPEVVAYWQGAQQVTEQRYRQARGVMTELAAAMRGALQEGYVFVLPTTPGAAPASGSKAAHAQAAFKARCLQFAALAALAGVPQVVVPVPVSRGLPLSISLLAMHKRDLGLLQAAARLGPMLAEEAARLAAPPRHQHAAQPPPSTSKAASGRRHGGRAGGSSSASAAVDAERVTQADALKAEGNAAYTAGRYDDAARHYSAAIQLNPRCSVFYANRALAYLKLGLYSLAEADCDAALGEDVANAKALLRRGSARMAQGNTEGARADFQRVLAVEPQNKQAREELRGMDRMQQQIAEG